MMEMFPEHLSIGLIDEIYTKEIKPRFFQDVRQPTVVKKRAIFVGGQPGCGKSIRERLITSELEEIEPHTTLEINGDDYRAFHPNYSKYLAEDDSTAASKIDQDNAQFTNRVIDESIAVGCHALVEGTFRREQVVISTASKYELAGYETEAVLLAVHPLLSRLGIMQRYAEQKRLSPYARYTERHAHEASLQGIPATMEGLIRGAHVGKIKIIDRSGSVLFEETLRDKTTEDLELLAQKAYTIVLERHTDLSEEELSFASEQVEAILQTLGSLSIPSIVVQELHELKYEVDAYKTTHTTIAG